MGPSCQVKKPQKVLRVELLEEFQKPFKGAQEHLVRRRVPPDVCTTLLNRAYANSISVSLAFRAPGEGGGTRCGGIADR